MSRTLPSDSLSLLRLNYASQYTAYRPTDVQMNPPNGFGVVCVSQPQIILVHSLISANENLCAQQSSILSNARLQSTIFVTETS